MTHSVLSRMTAMVVLFVVLMIPLALTERLIAERAARRRHVAADISRTWGRRQVVTGPVLSVPYRYAAREADGRGLARQGTLVLLPQTLDVKGAAAPEVRHRGPFSSVVYTARITMQGRFDPPDTSLIDALSPDVQWHEATLSLGVDDPAGIASGLRITWNGQATRVLPGVADTGLGKAGVQVSRLALPADRPSTFDVQMEVRGSDGIAFTPVGNDTTVILASSWPHPGFTVGQLPTTARISGDGFEAHWRSSWFARGFPAAWVRGAVDQSQLSQRVAAAAIGAELVQPVDVYRQSSGAVKYAALVIVLTLAVAFIREVRSALPVHPVQYLFVGFGLCLFYLLLVSLAEQIAFVAAYAIASTAIVGLVSWYWSSVLRSARQGRTLAAALTTLYGYLYLLLCLEDFALLAGATGLFVMLAVLMATTRHIDWFSVRSGSPAEPAGSAP